jgi:hypothetical protein
MHEPRSRELIAPEDMLLRRVLKGHVRKNGTVKPAAFMTKSKEPDPACSVYLERLTTPERVLEAARDEVRDLLRLAHLESSVPMGMSLDVVHVPIGEKPGSAEHAHSEIRGMTAKAECDKLAENCELVPK